MKNNPEPEARKVVRIHEQSQQAHLKISFLHCTLYNLWGIYFSENPTQSDALKELEKMYQGCEKP